MSGKQPRVRSPAPLQTRPSHLNLSRSSLSRESRVPPQVAPCRSSRTSPVGPCTAGAGNTGQYRNYKTPVQGAFNPSRMNVPVQEINAMLTQPFRIASCTSDLYWYIWCIKFEITGPSSRPRSPSQVSWSHWKKLSSTRVSVGLGHRSLLPGRRLR